MMDADDPRHGTNTGYRRGCRLACCRQAHMISLKKWRMGQGSKLIDPTGTQRRVRALMALGWTQREISERAGNHDRNWADNLLRQSTVTEMTAAKIARVYDELSMTIPTGPLRRRGRDTAARKGWPPPLAWDDIDSDPEPPPVEAIGNWENQVDDAVVQRVINSGVRPRKLTGAEAAEIVRLLLLRGLSTHRIENEYGLKTDRYRKVAA